MHWQLLSGYISPLTSLIWTGYCAETSRKLQFIAGISDPALSRRWYWCRIGEFDAEQTPRGISWSYDGDLFHLTLTQGFGNYCGGAVLFGGFTAAPLLNFDFFHSLTTPCSPSISLSKTVILLFALITKLCLSLACILFHYPSWSLTRFDICSRTLKIKDPNFEDLNGVCFFFFFFLSYSVSKISWRILS